MDIKGERMLEERYEPEGKLAQHLMSKGCCGATGAWRLAVEPVRTSGREA
jgi:hypothetical protein